MKKTGPHLKSSPRERSNSAGLADRLAEGAREAGVQVVSVYLYSLDIRPWDACDLCRDLDTGCVIEDEMQDLYPKLVAADAIVLVDPVCWFTASAQLKLCIDRWYAFQSSCWRDFQHKQAGIVLTYGDTDLYTSGGINAIHIFESMFHYLKMEIIGMVYGSVNEVGDVQRQPELMDRAFQLGRRLGKAHDRRYPDPTFAITPRCQKM